jgi:hypothetical protein
MTPFPQQDMQAKKRAKENTNGIRFSPVLRVSVMKLLREAAC